MTLGATSNFIIIGQDPVTKDFYYQQREDKDGIPGKINGPMGDGKGDVRGVVNSFVKEGFQPEKIIYNGQPITDVFTKVEDDNGNVSFKGVYKVSVPNDLNNIKDEKTKAAAADCIINTMVMGCNMSIQQPKVNKATNEVYFKINDNNDKEFENGFKNILDACNKQYNLDMAKKVYIQQVENSEYEKADPLN